MPLKNQSTVPPISQTQAGPYPTTDIHALRREYTRGGLDEAEADSDPFKQFERWFAQARRADLLEPNAMTLATVDSRSQPSARTVLLKEISPRGLVFFTNYRSHKAKNIEINPHVVLLFPWLALERQISISGTAEKISDQESDHYFQSRPAASKLGAWASPQSDVITSRHALEESLRAVELKFGSTQVPRPPFWGGIRVIPTEFEFWQGRTSRLHDRIRYSKQQDQSWKINRLAP